MQLGENSPPVKKGWKSRYKFLPPASCLLPPAFCLLPSAFCLLSPNYSNKRK
ncbi:MAG: hypothetical protein F6K47_31040 [Symploca sp. SIO2E6]|nr:hypothetical protein [Symploca sp. SIO2E6]